jgi:hypothetical protein
MPGGYGHARRQLAHLLRRHRFGTPHRIVKRGGDQVFEHVFVVGQEARVDRDALHVVFAGHRDLHQARARLALDLDRGELFLGLLQVVLHGLGLFHQAGDLVLHHGGELLRIQ